MIDDAERTSQRYQSMQAYLRLTHVYADFLGGLRWSSVEDAIVYEDGRFFAFSEAIAEFVDGFMAEPRVPAFGYLLHWMDLLQNQRMLEADAVRRLRSAFYETGGNWRNAGRFAAELMTDVPGVPEPPDATLLGRRLRDRSFPIRWFVSQFHESAGSREQPPIPPTEFEQAMLRKLQAYSEDDLKAWLKTGRGPIHGAERLADELPTPRSLARVLAALLERPRLAGAETYVSQLVGALTLPPRRLTPQELPVGGYTDIINRGQVEELLPTQFALDEMEFLRRYAEKELLYYRREEPPFQNRQELVVLLDQGVRTWGDVRLVLAAGALAFGRQALSRKTSFLLSATSDAGAIIDPLQVSDETLGQLIEASDLTLNPGLALECVLEALARNTESSARDGVARDIILLTHPRSLREPDVLAAARRLDARDRLFAATLDASGDAVLHEIRRGAALAHRRFRVDFIRSEPKPRNQPPTGNRPGRPWTGDIEHIPYPFRMGTDQKITHFDFDYAGEWLLTVSGQGSLHLWRLARGTQEMLPRPCLLGDSASGKLPDRAMSQVLAVIGVAGGFAVVGKFDHQVSLAHIDLTRRSIETYYLGVFRSDHLPLDYDRDHHSVVINAGINPQYVVDLRLTKADTIPIIDTSASTNPGEALRKTLGGDPAFVRRDLYLYYSTDSRVFEDGRHCRYDPTAGAFQLLNVASEPIRLVPIADGKPCFQGDNIRNVQLAADTLTVRADRRDIGDSITAIRSPDGAVLREYRVKRAKHKLVRHLLSFDGERLALLRSDQRVEIDTLSDRTVSSVCTRSGGFASNFQLFVGNQCVLLKSSNRQRHAWHCFHWHTGELEHTYHTSHANLDPLTAPALAQLGIPPRGPFLIGGPIRPKCCASDPERFIAGVQSRLWYVLDRFGQVAILDEDEQIIAMFCALRDRYAVWMPDGTRFGSQALNIGGATPGAAEAVSHALAAAARDAPTD